MPPPPPRPPTETFYDMSFPIGGLDNSQAFSDTRPRQLDNGEYAKTAQEAMNVRGYEADTQRRRGGSRPGISKFLPVPVVADWIIQDLNLVIITNDAATK